MPYRGMSYSRGSSYRRSEGSSWRGSSSRGGMSRVDNGGSRHYDSYPYESGRSTSRSYFQGHERYQSSRPRDESYHRESYRSSQDAEYPREYSRGSPDPPRKRIRTEASYSMASSRRSDERRFSSSASYGSRSHYMSEKPIGGYSMDKPSSFREPRESRPNEHSYRKSGVSLPRSRVSQRGRSFASTSRIRGRGQSRPSTFSTRRRAVEARRPYLSSKSTDYLRRLKNYKLKRSLKRNRESDDEAADLENLDLDEKDSDTEKNEEEAEQSGGESEVKEAEEKDTEQGDEKKDTNTEVKDQEKKPPKKSPKGKKPESDRETAEAVDDEGANVICCPHCKIYCSTFTEYRSHLTMARHQKSMKIVAGAIRTKLVKMRSDQRLEQRQLDNEAEGMKHLRTFFCSVCKLNYRTLKSDHQATPAHKKMKDFLQPYCKICKITCRSPMMYESHICDIRHIKREQRLEKLRAIKKDEEIREVDPNGFMVLDAVGSGDESDASETKEASSEKTAKATKAKEAKKEVKKKAESKGTEFCKLIQVYYCEICRKYLPRLDDKDRALSLHCRSTMHLIRYAQEMKIQRRKAHLSKKSKKEPSPKKVPAKEASEPKEAEVEDPPKDGEEADTESSDKKWLVVENDLNELLQVKKLSDEEEPGSPESDRCGRFKHGEDDEGTETMDKEGKDNPSTPNDTAKTEASKEEDA